MLIVILSTYKKTRISGVIWINPNGRFRRMRCFMLPILLLVLCISAHRIGTYALGRKVDLYSVFQIYFKKLLKFKLWRNNWADVHENDALTLQNKPESKCAIWRQLDFFCKSSLKKQYRYKKTEYSVPSLIMMRIDDQILRKEDLAISTDVLIISMYKYLKWS